MKLLDIIVALMKEVEKFKDYSGRRKKAYVMSRLLSMSKTEGIPREILEDIIDTLISVDKGKIKFNQKAVSSFFGGCCKPSSRK